MTWVKLSDQFYDDPDVETLSLNAIATYALVLSYCGRHLTDGHVSRARVTKLARGKQKATEELIQAGFLQPNGTHDSLVVRNWNRYQPSKVDVEKRRQSWADRQRRHRSQP